MEREDISKEEALHVIQKDDEERRKWSMYLYGIDTWDARLYDLVIHIHKLTIKDAVDMICNASRLEKFRKTPESQKAIDNLALAAQVKATLIKVKPDVQVYAHDGSITVKAGAPMLHESKLTKEIENFTKSIPGVIKTKVDIIPRGMMTI